MGSSVKAKFQCISKSENNVVVFQAVTSGSDENKTWARYTPSGQLTMTINNPSALEQFEVGKEYYLDFTPAS